MKKKIKSSRKFKEQKDFKIYAVRKEEEFVNIDRDLPEPFKPLFEKNGAAIALFGGMGSGKGNLLSNWLLREDFMKTLQSSNPSISPDWPLDLSSREDQQYVRDIALRGVEEMFEALQHLKNWKPHKHTEVKEFDRDAFLEEMVDDFTYKLEALILMGFTPEDFFKSFCIKNGKNVNRVKGDY